MKNYILGRTISFFSMLCVAVLATAQMAQSLEVKELTLSNGMTVWLNEDHTQPKVFGAVVVNAGGKDCPDTGIAHYFEHIMFKGTEEIGTIDYASEKPWLDSISAAYDKLAATTDAAQRTAIQRDINRLSQEAGKYAIPNEFNRLISRYGGSELNAGTSYDFTFYHNFFTPQYLEHWCVLNSDRLINPVFRMFQGELETVYEEKNMYSDQLMSTLRETVMSELFGTQPYAYPVIGSTENLKNPKLSDMKAFYEQYYVGSNMGLVLCGDFDAATVMPLLERTFGRIPQGIKPTRRTSPMPPITQERTVEVKIPIPLVSMELLAFNAPTEYDHDANALDIACKLLTNGQAGMLDSLVNEGDLMAAVLTTTSLNDAGMGMMFVIPNLLAKSSKAEARCLELFQRVINGDFTDEAFVTQKQEAYRSAFRELETIDDRAEKMVMVMSSGHSWQDYLNKVQAIDKVTKADVTAAAKHYLGAPFVRFKKKMGKTEKDKISQPEYTPVVAQNRNAESAYAQRLAALPVTEREPRLIDFDRDATTTSLGGQATLYTVKNPVNDLFELTISYNRGEKADPKLSAASGLLNASGTDSLSRQQLGAALQAYGADISFDSDDSSFDITVTGVDKHFDATMGLLGHLLNYVKPNEKALKAMKDAVKAEEKALDEENTDVLKALMHKIAFGDQSESLRRITHKEAKKLTGDELLASFREVLKSACTISYSGTLDAPTVERAVRKVIPVELSQQPFVDYSSEYLSYDRPIVYIYDKPDARQTLFLTYEQIGVLPTQESRIPASLLAEYFGGGMSSVLFQEVREFRSMAYTTGAKLLSRSRQLHPNSPVSFFTVTGTQGDKTMGALALVDSLLNDMPIMEKNFEAVRQESINEIYNDFPSFREMGMKIAAHHHSGYTADVNTGKASLLRSATIDDIRSFYESHVKNNSSHRVIGIVGNKKKLDLDALAKYGEVIILKEKDLFRK